MRLQMETAEKLAERVGPHTTFEAKYKESRHDQADQPVAASLCFPQRCLRVAVAALDRLEVTMHAAFGKSDALCKVPDTLLPVFTNRIANENAFGPQSHSVGLSSDRCLNSWRNSAPQST